MKIALTLPLLLLGLLSVSSPAEAQNKSGDEPFVADYYYKAKWGYADEFITLFKKNHYPVLKKQMETGRILSVTCVKPRYHATEDGRWDYRVTIVFKNMAAASDQASEEPIIKQLFPDQETYKREEQRRFEILLAHWDTPIVNVPLEK
jgi:TRAP-type mannitol/chloroaromatic compound transport system substrate-binding protein